MSTAPAQLKIGTAGWNVPRDDAHRFPVEGTTLERYAARFAVAEINSSFHRPHRLSTWQRWHDSVPEGFRFSAKLPKTITHQHRLIGCGDLLAEFITQVEALRDKLSVLLVQLPPKLELQPDVASSFFTGLRGRTGAAIVCEPRHSSWFTYEADAQLSDLGVARVAADPALCDAAALPGGWRGLTYWRLHGSPVIYRSSYADRIGDFATLIARNAARGGNHWCIFDNTASSAGAGDALALIGLLEQRFPQLASASPVAITRTP